jgi:hypothetical protein
MSMRHTAGLWLLGLACGLPPTTVAPEVNDQGKFFGAEAVKKANAKILDIARKYDRDVLVETFESLPDAPADKIKEMTGKERDAFYRNWAKKRANDRAVNGVYAVITREPTHLYVNQFMTTARERPGGRISAATGVKLREYLFTELSQKRFDEGLLGFVQRVEEALAANARK